ncbi:hypothetical protein KEM56_004466 [Ascosphaera pollenicola]|nr:hypothetical protein KEM56_004466 [Ascosphaera pollenicola]
MCQERTTPCTFEQKPPKRSSSKTKHVEKERRGSSSHSFASRFSEQMKLRGDSPSYAAQIATTNLPPVETSESESLHSGSVTASSPAIRIQDANSTTDLHITSNTLPPPYDLKNGERFLGQTPNSSAELYGLTSDMEALLMSHHPYDPTTNMFTLETHQVRRVLKHDRGMNYPLTFHIVSDEDTAGYSAAREQCEAIERCVAPHGKRLVNLFFRVVHPCFPIVDKQELLSRYATSYRAVPTPVLGAIYLISLRWWACDKDLNNKRPPDASALRQMVIDAIQNSYHRPKLASIQAALLFSQCKLENPLNPDHTWTAGITGQMLRISEALGLHLDASSWDIPPTERALRKRLSWALFMQDKWTALVHGRPSHINEDEDWAVQDLTMDDFLDLDGKTSVELIQDGDIPCTSPDSGELVFFAMVRLTKILARILRAFYTVRASKVQDTVVLYQQAREFLDELQTIQSEFASTLSMAILTPRQLCSNGYLHLGYHSIAICVWRRVVRSAVLDPPCTDLKFLTRMRKEAAEASENAMSFVAALRPDQLDAFWFWPSGFSFAQIGSFITLLIVTSPSKEENDYWKARLNEYLWVLRVMDKSSEHVQYAVNRLEGSILRGLEHALTDSSMSVCMPIAAPPEAISVPTAPELQRSQNQHQPLHQQPQQQRLSTVPEMDVVPPQMFTPGFEQQSMPYQVVPTSVEPMQLSTSSLLTPEAVATCSPDTHAESGSSGINAGMDIFNGRH